MGNTSFRVNLMSKCSSSLARLTERCGSFVDDAAVETRILRQPNFQGVTMGRLFPYLAVAVLLVGPGAAQTPHKHINPSPQAGPAGTADQSFHRAMAEAMDRMTTDMTIPHTGNPDRDFAAMMIPHHQGAIDMAKVQLQFGRDPILRRLAQAIIVEQQQEIDVMRHELSGLPSSASDSAASPTMQTHSDPATKVP
jgi:Domain of unknown function (DUF305)